MMESTTEAKPMTPPSNRNPALSQENKVQGHESRSGSRSSSKSTTQRILEPEVTLPDFKSLQFSRPAQPSPIELPQPSSERSSSPVILQPNSSSSQDKPKNIIREVHKIILSNVSSVELFHSRDAHSLFQEPETVAPQTMAPQATAPTEPDSTVQHSEESLAFEAAKKLTVKCLYRLEYRDQNDNLLQEKEGDTASSVKPPKRIDESVIEVITTIRVQQSSDASAKDFKPESARGKDEGTELKINSVYLVNALRAVVSYYPGVNLLEEPLKFAAPYKVLVHHRKALEEYKRNHPSNHDEQYVKESNRHIDVLLDFFRSNFGGEIEAEELRHQQEPPICTYKYLWMLFPPGVDIFTVPSGTAPSTPPSVYVASRMLEGEENGDHLPHTLEFWNLESDGEYIRRVEYQVEISPFDGEREVRSLVAYPMTAIVEKERKEIEERFEQRGRRYYDYTTVSHMQFNGWALTRPRRRYDTRVVLDTYEYWTFHARGREFQSLDIEFDGSVGVSGCSCDECSTTKNAVGKVRFASYDKIRLKAVDPTQELTRHQYILCTQKIWGFALKHKEWQLLDMADIRDISFDKEVMNELVLDQPGNKNLIKALAKRYTEAPAHLEIGLEAIDLEKRSGATKNDPWAADRVEGKGEGQIILLHGPPGVGKTRTAESVAEYAERPLLSLKCGDIGIVATEVEFNLEAWMKRARRWGAVLLIDEADIYLEERTPHNFQHNSLVSVFLRNLEYYSGILFLTTNRVGVFDEAISSRIHIPIAYNLFNDKTRETIWDNMIKRLERERKTDIFVPLSFKKYVKNDADLKRLEWNGREIRNAFQTAVSLAEYYAKEEGLEVAELKDEFLDQVVQMSSRFKNYLASFPDGNITKKAWQHGKRNDIFDKA